MSTAVLTPVTETPDATTTTTTTTERANKWARFQVYSKYRGSRISLHGAGFGEAYRKALAAEKLIPRTEEEMRTSTTTSTSPRPYFSDHMPMEQRTTPLPLRYETTTRYYPQPTQTTSSPFVLYYGEKTGFHGGNSRQVIFIMVFRTEKVHWERECISTFSQRSLFSKVSDRQMQELASLLWPFGTKTDKEQEADWHIFATLDLSLFRPEQPPQQPLPQPSSGSSWTRGGKDMIPSEVASHLTHRDHLEAIHDHLRYIYDRLDDLLDRVHQLEIRSQN